MKDISELIQTCPEICTSCGFLQVRQICLQSQIHLPHKGTSEASYLGAISRIQSTCRIAEWIAAAYFLMFSLYLYIFSIYYYSNVSFFGRGTSGFTRISLTAKSHFRFPQKNCNSNGFATIHFHFLFTFLKRYLQLFTFH